MYHNVFRPSAWRRIKGDWLMLHAAVWFVIYESACISYFSVDIYCYFVILFIDCVIHKRKYLVFI